MTTERSTGGTRVLVVQPDLAGSGDRERLAAAAAILREGGTVAFPTETVYGLGARGLDPQAVRRIFDAKGRPDDNPLILHVAGVGQAVDLVGGGDLPAGARELMERFWPGPLTLVLPRGPAVPDIVTAGLDTVAVRCPDHPVARALLAAVGGPVAAPSANLSGRPSPTRAEHVLEDLSGQIDAVLDGGPTGVGVESTVVDLVADPPRVLRPGGVPVEALQEILPHLMVPEGTPEEDVPRSPGMRYRHYAPQAELILLGEGPWGEREMGWLLDETERASAAGRTLAVLVSRGTATDLKERIGDVVVEALAPWGDGDAAARRLFHALRTLDDRADVIVAEPVMEEGRGVAVMNRLRKAAGRVIHLREG